MIILRIVTVVLVLSLQSIAAGSTNVAWDAYLAGNFDRVEALVTEAISDTSLTETDLAQYYLALGCSDAMRGRSAGAVMAFEVALTLNPMIKLTSSDLPPPVWKLFEPIQKRMPKYKEIVKPDSVQEQKVTLSDTIRQFVPIHRNKFTIAQSLLLPGWGHLAEDRQQGYLFATVGIASLSGWITTAILSNKYRKEYLAARSQDEISRNYSKYNNYYRLTWGMATLTVINFLYAQIDFLDHPPPLSLDLSNQALELKLTFLL